MDRNFIGNEYYKNKILLNEKKNKKIMQEPAFWDIDKELCNKLGLDIDLIQGNPALAWKFMFSDETKKLREYADLFAVFNQNIFNEILKFEEYQFKSFAGNFKTFAEKNVENITQNHLMYAELLSDIADLRSVILKA